MSALVALEAVLAAVLGIVALGSRSYWLDESVSVTIAGLGWDPFWDVVTEREANMSLYHLLLSGWTGVLGDSEWSARSMSVVAGVLTVPFAFLLGRRLAGTNAGLAAGLLLAVNPMFIRYAQEARGYALCLLLVTVASYLFVRGLQEPGTGVWVGYAVVAALAAYAHFFALLVPAAHAVALLFVRPRPWRLLALAAGLLAVLLVPLVLLVRANESSGIEWASGNAVGRLLTDIHDRPALAVAALVAGAIVAGAVWLVLHRRIGERAGSDPAWGWVFVCLWLLVPLALVAVVGVVFRPLFVIRYFIVLLPAAVLLLAMLATAARRRGVVVALTVGLAALSLAATANWYATGEEEDWRGATRHVVESSRPGDGVMIYAPYTRIPFALYRTDIAADDVNPRPVYPADGWDTPAIRFDYYVPVTTDGVAEAGAGFDRVWLVKSHAELYGARDEGYDAVLAGLAASDLEPMGTESFPGVEVVRYERGSRALDG